MSVLVLVWLLNGKLQVQTLMYPSEEACTTAEPQVASFKAGVLKGQGDDAAADSLHHVCVQPFIVGAKGA